MTGPGNLALAVQKAAHRVVNMSANESRPAQSDLCELDLHCLRWLESRERIENARGATETPDDLDDAWLRADGTDHPGDYGDDFWLGASAGPGQARG